jgi:Carboxypeptidase regulatory-like domain
MRFTTPMRLCALLAMMTLSLSGMFLFAQETTGGLQGTVRDASGAVVGGAHVVVRGSTLAGDKALDTEPTGYYRFANLPPGVYSIEVTARGFKTEKRGGLTLEVGRLPTVDMTLEVGTAAEVIEVTGQAPVVDVTTNTNQTNLTQDVIDNSPHGYSFQSVIQYAPMARNEPLAGGAGGNGGAPPGSTSSGNANGFSIGGAADSESAYLVEGQDTENISMGFSNANVPFDFIQEVQVKTSGVEAEHGGALGGVINVVMKKGSNAYHGAIFATYEANAMDGGAQASLRYDPFNLANTGLDNNSQIYQPKQDHFRFVEPGFSVGGPIVKDRVWFFLGLAPLYQSTARTVNFGAPICNTLSPGAPTKVCPNYGLGNQIFNQDSQQYFGTARIDATLTSKIRVFGSWLYQYGRESGANLPGADPVAAEAPYLVNESILGTTVQGYSHGLGFASPNSTYNVGADITLTPKIVSTTRFGYFFNNYHDFGWPTSGADIVWRTTGLGKTDNLGKPLPANLQQGAGAFTTPYDGTYTLFNASKHYQFDEDVAFFKSGWAGTHNIKVGYQFNKMSNVIDQNGNVPLVRITPGARQNYGFSTTVGSNNCYGPAGPPPAVPSPGSLAAEWGICAGQYGWAYIQDFATILNKPATDNNHALFVQDAWTVGHGLTLNLGLRIEKENLPVPPGVVPSGFSVPASINFAWSDKIEPRLGAAWGSRNGKLKIFGSYGVVNDVMKLLLAQTSWGAQTYNRCAYPLGPDASGGFNTADLNPVFVGGRACPNGVPTTGANFPGGTVPPSFTDAGTGIQLIENVDYRPWEPVAPGVKPYRQHEYVAGVDYQIGRNWALEARYDRRRLDHAIEDASLADPTNFEIYTIVNPGQGVNKTVDGYATYLDSLGSAYGVPGLTFNKASFGTCPTCPNNPQAVRNYDGLEFRLTKAISKGWAGMFSYTWSSLWGNYPGLTTTDQTDGGSTGRASPDTTRSFDEPFYYFGANGKSNNGPLPTDRPNTIKGNVYYALPWKGMTTTLGLFQVAYEGSPLSAANEIGITNTGPIEDTYIYGRGKWVNVSQDPTTGAVTIGNPYNRRTPWYTQTDFNFIHAFKVNKNNEHQVLQFQATITNLLNQRAPVSYWETFASYFNPSGIFPGASASFPSGQNISGGAAFYQAAETGYNVQAGIAAAPYTLNSEYGRPNLWQISRSIRLGVKFTF